MRPSAEDRGHAQSPFPAQPSRPRLDVQSAGPLNGKLRCPSSGTVCSAIGQPLQVRQPNGTSGAIANRFYEQACIAPAVRTLQVGTLFAQKSHLPQCCCALESPLTAPSAGLRSALMPRPFPRPPSRKTYDRPRRAAAGKGLARGTRRLQGATHRIDVTSQVRSAGPPSIKRGGGPPSAR